MDTEDLEERFKREQHEIALARASAPIYRNDESGSLKELIALLVGTVFVFSLGAAAGVLAERTHRQNNPPMTIVNKLPENMILTIRRSGACEARANRAKD